MNKLLIASTLLLGGCLYQETPFGRTAAIDLPLHNQTTINKTVTVNAPPGTTVILQDSMPVGYPRPYPPRPYYRYHGNRVLPIP
ncbi:methionine-binding protein [Neisseria chenwenguii]|uniref:Methionine-binding protein n=1 Tax=Neisseria chenwenguii TaxID=1853278 RepID=A0A220RZ55_9NEIS|nr:methionine-binding protein [Neisseria chenwenguii]ASK26457.1 methionine-binding protein [Neisseria chenwenguii]ROV55899.1 methionine-binding protein [Neisseria chenwenguii]